HPTRGACLASCLQDGVDRAGAGEPDQVARAQGRQVRGRAGADPDRVVGEQALVDRTSSTFGNGNGATAPGAKPVESRTSAAVATRAFVALAARAILSRSARRSPGTSAITGRS